MIYSVNRALATCAQWLYHEECTMLRHKSTETYQWMTRWMIYFVVALCLLFWILLLLLSTVYLVWYYVKVDGEWYFNPTSIHEVIISCYNHWMSCIVVGLLIRHITRHKVQKAKGMCTANTPCPKLDQLWSCLLSCTIHDASINDIHSVDYWSTNGKSVR